MRETCLRPCLHQVAAPSDIVIDLSDFRRDVASAFLRCKMTESSSALIAVGFI